MEAARPLQERHLPFDADLVPLKPGQAIAIDTHLPVHEINELPQYVQFGAYLLVVHGNVLPEGRAPYERQLGASGSLPLAGPVL